MTKGEQLHYTCSYHGESGRPGLQVRTSSPGLGAGEKRAILQISGMQIPRSLEDGLRRCESMEEAEPLLEKAPYAIRFMPKPPGGCFSHVTYIGKEFNDFSRRWGNLFVHGALVSEPEPGARPCDLAFGTTWKQRLDPGEDVEGGGTPDPLPALELFALADAIEEARSFVAENPRRASLLKAMISSVEEKKKVVVVDSLDRQRLWVLALHCCVPPEFAWQLGFSTYEANVGSASWASFVGVLPEGAAQMKQGAVDRRVTLDGSDDGPRVEGLPSTLYGDLSVGWLLDHPERREQCDLLAQRLEPNLLREAMQSLGILTEALHGNSSEDVLEAANTSIQALREGDAAILRKDLENLPEKVQLSAEQDQEWRACLLKLAVRVSPEEAIDYLRGSYLQKAKAHHWKQGLLILGGPTATLDLLKCLQDELTPGDCTALGIAFDQNSSWIEDNSSLRTRLDQHFPRLYSEMFRSRVASAPDGAEFLLMAGYLIEAKETQKDFGSTVFRQLLEGVPESHRKELRWMATAPEMGKIVGKKERSLLLEECTNDLTFNGVEDAKKIEAQAKRWNMVSPPACRLVIALGKIRSDSNLHLTDEITDIAKEADLDVRKMFLGHLVEHVVPRFHDQESQRTILEFCCAMPEALESLIDYWRHGGVRHTSALGSALAVYLGEAPDLERGKLAAKGCAEGLRDASWFVWKRSIKTLDRELADVAEWPTFRDKILSKRSTLRRLFRLEGKGFDT